MKTYRQTIAALILLIPLIVSAQAYSPDLTIGKVELNPYLQSQPEGELSVYQDSRIDDMVNRHVLGNMARKGMDGYRIQVYFGSGARGREEAYEANAKALSHFPDMKVYIIYQHTYYKVRLGDFRNRIEAFCQFREIRRRFPNAYIVPDVIEFPPLD